MARNKRELIESEKSVKATKKGVEIWYAALMLAGLMISPTWPWLACILCLAVIIVFIHYMKTDQNLFPSLPWLKRTVWDRAILGRIMGFGTRLVPAFCAWLLLAFSLGLVLSNPKNVQPTFAAVNVGLGRTDLKINTDVPADREKLAKARNDLQKLIPEDWGFWNHAFWLALDITVPLIPFNLHDEWEPRESTANTAFPCCTHSEMPIAPKTMANIFTPLSWIIWSLFATGMAGLIRTRN